MNNDAHGNPLTDERLKFTSSIAQQVLPHSLTGYKVYGYSPQPLRTRARLCCEPAEPTPMIEWPTRNFVSTSIERGIKRALNPQTDLPSDARVRIALASWHNEVGLMLPEDCEQLILLSFAQRRSLKGKVNEPCVA